MGALAHNKHHSGPGHLPPQKCARQVEVARGDDLLRPVCSCLLTCALRPRGGSWRHCCQGQRLNAATGRVAPTDKRTKRENALMIYVNSQQFWGLQKISAPKLSE